MNQLNSLMHLKQVAEEFGGIENTITLNVGGEAIAAVPETDVERTTAAGKTSSIHFLRFRFTRPQIEAFRRDGARVILGIAHPNYDHMAALPEPVRAALAADFG